MSLVFYFVVIEVNESPMRNIPDVNLSLFLVLKPVIVDCTHIEILYHISHLDMFTTITTKWN